MYRTCSSRTHRVCSALTLLALVLVSYAPTGSFANDPLFAQIDAPMLELELTLPLSELLKKRKSKHTVVGELHHAQHNISVSVTPRGKSRLERCRFPPLWLDLKKKQTEGTVFEHQNKIKLVTHCGNNMTSKGYLAAEMVAYRLLNLLTDQSFRVRAVHVTYNDTDNGRSQTHYGFLIEHKKRLAKRLNVDAGDYEKLKLSSLDIDYVSLANLYQYMIGNTDFSFTQGPPDDDCCHNSVPALQESGSYVSIPYDFDSSGFVNPPYAVPAESLGLRRLTQRRYRGFCRHNGTLAAAREAIITAKPAVLELIDTFDDIPHLNRKRATKFLDGFYDIIESDQNYQRKIVKVCRKR